MRARVAPSSASARTSTASCAVSSRRSRAGRAIRPTTRSSTMSGRRSSGACRRSSGERLLVLALLQLGAEQIAEGAEALSRRHPLVHLPLVLAVIGSPFRPLRSAARETVATAIVDVDDPRLELRPRRQRLLVVAAARRAELGIRHQPLAALPVHEHAERLALVHGGVDHVAHAGALLLLRPGGLGRLRLLLADPAQRDASLGIVDRLDLHPDRLSLFHHLAGDRKSTRLNSSHSQISYAVFCLKKKNRSRTIRHTPTMQ